MADDKLELIASVKNLTSGPIRDIQRSLRALAADSKAAHRLGISQAKSYALAHDLRGKCHCGVVQLSQYVFSAALKARKFADGQQTGVLSRTSQSRPLAVVNFNSSASTTQLKHAINMSP